MSSTVSQESRVMLAELLLAEKENTRLWLRAEMDRLMDPMVDLIFDKITNKLMNATMESDQFSDDAVQLYEVVYVPTSDPFNQTESLNSQVVQSANVIAQPSSSSSFMTPEDQQTHQSIFANALVSSGRPQTYTIIDARITLPNVATEPNAPIYIFH